MLALCIVDFMYLWSRGELHNASKHSANLAASPALLVLIVHAFAELGTESGSLVRTEPVLYH